MPTDRPAVDISGRPLRLRDVDLDTFLNPKTIAVIGASEQSAKPNTAMTRKFSAWAKQHGATFYPVHPTYETVLGHKCYASLEEVPGDLDLAIILTGRVVDTFEEVLQRKAKFAVIFAAGFSETGAEGEQLEQRLDGLVRAGDVRLLGPNTNLNVFEEFRADLEGPSIALITQSGHQGRPGVPGPGDRYPAHALGTDRQRGRPRVRRLRALLRRPARGRCHRLLHRGLQGRPHVDARGRPRRAAAQADRDGEGGPHRGGPVDGRVAYRAPHRFGCGHRARCSASSA